ncbi:MAG: ATP synthase F1 subunit gamma [Betaproteobacteria bacterium]|nr:ATP synthase F1 subunit gamma [Betaproteobacteria bacterium]
MPSSKEIRTKIKSVQNTRKITKAMEMVAASKMRKAQERMRAARPYGDKIRIIAAHLSQANPEYRHPYLVKHSERKAAGMILVTTDKGLCGGLNTNVLRAATQKLRELQQDQLKVQATAIGNKGLGFLGRVGVPVVSHVVQLGDTPHLERLIGAVKVQLDAYVKGEIDVVYLAYTRFINTMKQEPVIEQLLPLTADRLGNVQPRKYGWDYLYEPDAVTVLDELLTRFIEAPVAFTAMPRRSPSDEPKAMVRTTPSPSCCCTSKVKPCSARLAPLSSSVKASYTLGKDWREN